MEKLHEFDALADVVGAIRVTNVGEENIYFEFTAEDGSRQRGFVKGELPQTCKACGGPSRGKWCSRSCYFDSNPEERQER